MKKYTALYTAYSERINLFVIALFLMQAWNHISSYLIIKFLPEYNSNIVSDFDYFFLLIMTLFFAPLVETFISQLIFYELLIKRISGKILIHISAFIFAFLHWFNYLQFFRYLIFGYAFAYFYVKNRKYGWVFSFFFTVLLHSFFNLYTFIFNEFLAKL